MAFYSFTHKIKSLDISAGNFLVEYIPDDTDLSPVLLNLSISERSYTTIRDENTNEPLYTNQESVPFSYHYEYTINNFSPQNVWNNQKHMLNNLEFLQNKM